MFEIDKLLEFLRLDKNKMQLEKVGVTYNDDGLQIVELVYLDRQKRLNRCVIGVNGSKINEFATGQHPSRV